MGFSILSVEISVQASGFGLGVLGFKILGRWFRTEGMTLYCSKFGFFRSKLDFKCFCFDSNGYVLRFQLYRFTQHSKSTLSFCIRF